MGRNPVGYIISIVVAIFLVLAFIPVFHELVQDSAAGLPPFVSFLIRFLFDPLDFVWKWILALLFAVVYLVKRLQS